MRKLIIATAAALALLAGCSAEDLASDTSTSSTNTHSAAAAADDASGSSYHDPVAGDFKVTVKTLEKQCFGSAGCNITFRVRLAYDDSAGELDPDKTYELTYRVRGGEDPLTNTLELTGDDYSTDREEFIMTSSSAAKLTAKVLEVEEV